MFFDTRDNPRPTNLLKQLLIGTVFRTVLYWTVFSFIFIFFRTVLYWNVLYGTVLYGHGFLVDTKIKFQTINFKI